MCSSLLCCCESLIWGGGLRCHGSASRLTQKFGFRETEKWEQNYISVQCWYSEPLCSADAGRSITSTDLISSVWCAEMIVHYFLLFVIWHSNSYYWLTGRMCSHDVALIKHWPKDLGVFKCMRIVCCLAAPQVTSLSCSLTVVWRALVWRRRPEWPPGMLQFLLRMSQTVSRARMLAKVVLFPSFWHFCKQTLKHSLIP